MITVMAEECAAELSEAVVGLALHGRSRRSMESWLDGKLVQLREDPQAACAWLEECVLRGLAGLSPSGPEHAKRTGRAAGGGTLTKGS